LPNTGVDKQGSQLQEEAEQAEGSEDKFKEVEKDTEDQEELRLTRESE